MTDQNNRATMADPTRPLWCEAALVGGWGVDRNGEVSEETIGTAALRDVIPDEEMRALASIICTVDDARRLATEVIEQRNGNEAECPCCIHGCYAGLRLGKHLGPGEPPVVWRQWEAPPAGGSVAGMTAGGSAPTHADGCPLDHLVALLSGDGTP